MAEITKADVGNGAITVRDFGRYLIHTEDQCISRTWKVGDEVEVVPNNPETKCPLLVKGKEIVRVMPSG